MIMISSTAGKRLAKAYAQLDQARRDQDHFKVRILLVEFHCAAEKVGEELVEASHHTAQGD